MKKIVTIVTLCAFLFSGCASWMPEIQKKKLDNEAAAAERRDAIKMKKLDIADKVVNQAKVGGQIPDSAVFREIMKEDKVTNENDVSVALIQETGSTLRFMTWPALIATRIGAVLSGLGSGTKADINAENSEINFGRDGSFNQGTGGDIRIQSPNVNKTDTRTDTKTDTDNSNPQSNSGGGDNN